MREFKFRAYSTSSESMNMLDPKHPDGFNFSCLVEDENWKVMQWTGLKGKDNKYIYEHDIVLFEGKPFVVWYVNRVGCFRLRPIFMFTFGGQRQHDGALSFSKKFRDCYCYEVIGNIYENPELLEQP